MTGAWTAAAVFAFWLVLSAPPGPADLAWGGLVAVLAGAWSATFLWPDSGPGLGLRSLAGLSIYTLDLIRSIIPAALQVACVVLHPALPVKPVVITYRMSLRLEISRVALANAITLTPGTHCVDSEGDLLTVHCLDERFGDDIRSGRAEARVARLMEPG